MPSSRSSKPAPSPGAPASGLVAAVPGTGLSGAGNRRAYLVVLTGPHFGEMFRLESDRDIEIGRGSGSDLVMQDAGVSRRHATIRVEGEGAVIRDLGSRNGTFVNGQPVAQARVGDGARIQLGAATTFRFAMSDATEEDFQRRLGDAALRDPLTGLHNRAMFSERLMSEVAAFQARARPLAVVALDVDHFKSVNDQHGHAAGDAVLKATAAVVREAVSAEDVVARWGGEEFVLLLRDTSEARALAVAERVRAAVAAATTVWRGTPLRVTLSVGVAVLSPQRRIVAEAAQRVLLEAADRALYRAKRRGRDRVELEEAGV